MVQVALSCYECLMIPSLLEHPARNRKTWIESVIKSDQKSWYFLFKTDIQHKE